MANDAVCGKIPDVFVYGYMQCCFSDSFFFYIGSELSLLFHITFKVCGTRHSVDIYSTFHSVL